MESVIGQIGEIFLNIFARLTSTTPSQFYANRSRYTLYLFLFLFLVLIVAGVIGYYKYKESQKIKNSQKRF